MEAKKTIKEEVINNKYYRIAEESYTSGEQTNYYISVEILRTCIFWKWWACVKLYHATSKRARRAQINNATSYLVQLIDK